MEEYLIEDYRNPKGCLLGLVIGLVVMMLVLLSGCSPKVVETMVVVTDTCYVAKERWDSVHIQDSIYIHEYQRADTVFVERVRWMTQWRERVVTDTAYVSRRDTVRVTDVAAERQRTLTMWEAAQMWMGRMALVALAVAALVFVVRWRYWRP